MPDTITIDEIKKLIQENKIQPQALFTKEALLADPSIILHVQTLGEEEKKELEKYRADNKALNEQIEKGIEADKKKKEEEERQRKEDDEAADEFIPDVDEKGKPGSEEEDELIPD